MSITASRVIDRPPDVVFRFIGVDHVRNHPRWDPAMSLEQLSEGPIRVGTRLARRHTRVGVPIEGTMEVTEFEPNRAFGVVIRDVTPNGMLEVRSRMTFEPTGDGGTALRLELELPGAEASMDPRMIERSLDGMKSLIEAET